MKLLLTGSSYGREARWNLKTLVLCPVILVACWTETVWSVDPLPRCGTTLNTEAYPALFDVEELVSGTYGYGSILADIDVIQAEPPDCNLFIGPEYCAYCPSSHPYEAWGGAPYRCYNREYYCPPTYERTSEYTCKITSDCRCAHDGLPNEVAGYLSCDRPKLKTCSDGTIVAADGGICPAKTQQGPATCVGNPIDFASGDKIQTELDFKSGGDFPLLVSRTYSSRQSVAGTNWRFSFTPGGYKTLEFPVYLTYPPPEHYPVIVRSDDGSVLEYRTVDGQIYTTDSDVLARLEKTLSGWKFTAENGRIWDYSADGRLRSIREIGGLSHYYSWSSDELKVTNDFGHTLRVFQRPEGASRVVLPDGGELLYAYNAEGLLESVTYADGTMRLYHYEAELGQLTGITNERGVRYASFEYTGSRATATEHAGGVNRHEVIYSNTSDLVSVTNPLGKSFTYRFDTNHGARKIKSTTRQPSPNCPSSSASYTYDDHGFVIQEHHYNNRNSYFERNARGLITQINESDLRFANIQWHQHFPLPEVVTEARTETRYTFDPYENPNYSKKSIMDLETGEIREWRYTYNNLGQVLSIDGPRDDLSDLTLLSYHDCVSGAECGQIHTITNPLGHVITYESYSANAQATRVIDANGVVTELAYDDRQRLITVSVAGQLSTYEYLDTGRLARHELPDGSYIKHEYDDAERLIALTNNNGERIEWTLDEAGNRVEERYKSSDGSLVKQIRLAYDELSRIRLVTHAHGSSETYAHDNMGNLKEQTDALGRTTEHHYDSLNRYVRHTDAAGGTTHINRDIQDNIISVRDPENLTTEYEYNGFGDLLRMVSPDSGETLYSEYDKSGNPLSITDARGVTVSRQYDALNRLVTVAYPNSTENITYTYDQDTNGLGRLTRIVDSSGQTNYSYDNRGNVTKVQSRIGGASYTTLYQYDDANRLTGMTYPGGRQLLFERNAIGQIVRVIANGDEIASNATYHPFGPLAGLTLGNGVQRTREVDLDYRVQTYEDGSILNRNYGFDGNNNISAITDGIQPDAGQFFAYDTLNRLEFATGLYGERTYAYDAVGNRLSVDLDSVIHQYGYGDENHRVLSVNGEGVDYDAAGNIVAKDSLVSVYGDRNRMVSITGNEISTSYVYNALGQRVIKSTDGIETHYLYDQIGRVIAEAVDGRVSVEYSYFYNEPLAMWRIDDDDLPTEPPSTPSLVAPFGSILEASPSYEWELQPGVEQYRLRIYNRLERSWVFDQTFDVGEICDEVSCSETPDVILPESRNHLAQLRAGNAAGWSAWSAYTRFHVLPPLPVAPVANHPVGNINTGSPIYRWTGDAVASEYWLRVYDRIQRSWVFDQAYDSAQICDDTECSVDPELSLPESRNHMWQVRARNVAGWSDWSNRSYFHFVPLLSSAPEPMGPVGDIVTGQPVYLWRGDPLAARYRLRIYDRSLRSWVFDQTYDSELVCIQSDCSVSPALSLPVSRNRIWRVRAWNLAGWSRWSNLSYFHVVEESMPESVLINGGFEQGLHTWFSCSDDGYTEIVGNSSEGVQAMLLSGGDCLYQEFAVAANETYSMSCKAKSGQSGWASISLTVMDSGYHSLVAEEVPVTSDEYQSLSAVVTVPGTGSIGALTFYSDETSTFDACRVVQE